jgi:fumarylacetoacetate (FAA) hydrolase
MRLATLRDGSPDGALIVVSHDGARFARTGTSLIAAMDEWTEVEPVLRALATGVGAGAGDPLDTALVGAPLPRSWQWLDGSAFGQHGELMQIAFNQPPIETERPLMYQGMSDRFYGPTDPIPFASEADGIDFEGEFGVIVDAVPMGIAPRDAAHHIRLIVQINDWSLRTFAPVEMKTGFGWIQAKPACGLAPFAVTPDELGADWCDGRVGSDLLIEWNGNRFGLVKGDQMAFSFPELVAHAARTRDLVAGTMIGSGTVSNREYATRGSACIAERQAIEIIEHGAPVTAFMRFGDKVRMEGRCSDGRTPFGAIDQVVAKAQPEHRTVA